MTRVASSIKLSLLLCVVLSTHAVAQQSVTTEQGRWAASFSAPTDRYGHAVLGSTPEWGKLCLTHSEAEGCVTLPENRVFEDIAPRLSDVDGDGRLDAVVVESDAQAGASLAIYMLEPSGQLKRIANDPIGTRFRWLAPIGIADLDGDGHTEVAYIDRPHLAKTLRILRFVDSGFIEVATQTGLTNHRIGEAFITSGLRQCEGAPIEILTVDASWSSIMASSFDGPRVTTRSIGPFHGLKDMQTAMECQN